MGGALALPALWIVGTPGDATTWQLGATIVLHVAYIVTLAAAYQHGDFSLAYPIARGGGAMLAALGGVVLLGDHLSVAAWGSIAVIALGLALLSWTRTTAASLRWAALTALVIGMYTVVDGDGSRAAVSGESYGFALLAGTGAAVVLLATARGRWGDLVAERSSWSRWFAGGLLMDTAYVLVLIAVRHAPVGYVAILRESSIVLAALVGWLALHEHLGGRRVAASALMTVGLIGLVWADLG